MPLPGFGVSLSPSQFGTSPRCPSQFQDPFFDPQNPSVTPPHLLAFAGTEQTPPKPQAPQIPPGWFLPSLPQGFLLSLPGLSPPLGALLPPIFVTPPETMPSSPNTLYSQPGPVHAPSSPHWGGPAVTFPPPPHSPRSPPHHHTGVPVSPPAPRVPSSCPSPLPLFTALGCGTHRGQRGAPRVTQGTGWPWGHQLCVTVLSVCPPPWSHRVLSLCQSRYAVSQLGVTKSPHLCRNLRDPSSVTTSCP